MPSKNKRDRLENINSLLSLVSKQNIQTSIKTLTSFQTRHTKSELINQVADWLKNTIQSLSYGNVYFHDYNENGYELKNVVFHKQGATDKVILMCAHYDSRMEDINDFENTAPGADDNATGISILLEMARILSQVQLQDSIQIVFFSGEEQGQWGSRNYARHLHNNNVNLHRLINLDMVGRPSSNQKVLVERDIVNEATTNDQDSQLFGEMLAQAAIDYTDLEVELSHIYGSDYMPFEALGYVVAGVYDGGETDIRHHSNNDLPSALNMDYLVSVTKMVLATVLDEAKVRSVI